MARARRSLPKKKSQVDAQPVETRLRALLEQFHARIKRDHIGQFASPPEDLLYHYTDITGLKGIIEHDELWATHYGFVNDLTEFVYTQNVLHSDIITRLPHPNPHVGAVLNAILSADDFVGGAIEIFIACFCETADLLSQWRSYSGRGGGFAIGLKPNMAHIVNGRRYQLYKVHYDPHQHQMLIKELLDTFCTVVEELCANIDPADIVGKKPLYLHRPQRVPRQPDPAPQLVSDMPAPLNQLCINLSIAINEVACCFKNKNFEIEKEWRLVSNVFKQSRTGGVCVRLSGTSLVPYVKLPLQLKGYGYHHGHGNDIHWKFSLEHIMCGPGLKNRGVETSLNYLTAQYFSDAVPIEHSTINVKI